MEEKYDQPNSAHQEFGQDDAFDDLLVAIMRDALKRFKEQEKKPQN